MTSTILTSSEMDMLRTTYPMVDLDPLTAQEEQLLLYRMRGMTEPAAAKAAGMSTQRGKMLLSTPKFGILLEYLLKQTRQNIRIDVDMLNGMLLASHKKAATSMEEIAAVRELGKLNDLYPSEKKTLKIDVAKITSTRQIEDLSDQDLAELAGDVIDLDPEDVTDISNG